MAHSTNRRLVRNIVTVAVLLATVAAFAYYIQGHPETVGQLRRLPLATFLGLLALYVVFMATLAWIQRATLLLCDITLPGRESFLLTAYSSIINFFGPLQSGPAFRAAYLKRRHNVNLKKYTVATLAYYGLFASFSGLFILTYFFGLWALLGITVAVLAIPLILARPNLLPARFRNLQLRHIGQLASATLAQVVMMAVIFYVELNSLGNHVGKVATLIYTGAANFALFVSVTPGAIGFRETFVSFTQGLHYIASNQIVTASLIDRGTYIIFLAVLAAVVFGLHAADRFKKD